MNKPRGIKAYLRRLDYTPLLVCWGVAVFYAFFCLYLGRSAVGSSGYYTYTLQALAWREGRFALERDYPWLELAVYQGKWYVSFPPVPSVPLFLLSFLFGSATPDNLLVKLYVLIGCLAIYKMLRRSGYGKPSAACFAVFCSFGSCLLCLTTEGAVWYQAQTLAFSLTALALALMVCRRPTLSLLCYALAVGCRPFNALYGLLLFSLYADQCVRRRLAWRPALRRLLPGIVLGLCVACAYGWYNWLRFGSIFEFGHNYLPEFSTQGGVQFSLAHIPANFRTFVLGLPFGKTAEGWQLNVFGFSFLLANPILLLTLCRIAADCFRRRLTPVKGTLLFCFLLQLLLLLMHRTFGGYQFGARYTCDLLHYAALYLALPGRPRRITPVEAPIFCFALIFAVYGAASVLL